MHVNAFINVNADFNAACDIGGPLLRSPEQRIAHTEVRHFPGAEDQTQTVREKETNCNMGMFTLASSSLPFLCCLPGLNDRLFALVEQAQVTVCTLESVNRWCSENK